MGVYDLNQQEYNLKLAEALRKISEIKEPEWVMFVKSGMSKERPIEDVDFWHKRTASVLKQIYKKKIVGVSRLRTKYGSKKDRGMRPSKFKKAGGKIIRVILQQLDSAGFTEKIPAVKGTRKKAGRQLTAKGKEFMEEVK
jgi:small subunit ribosomal protein S19e